MARKTGVLLWLLVTQLVGGCASTGGVVSYVHPNMDFGHVRRCAVLPFQNLSPDGLAAERMHSVFVMEVLSEGVLDMVGPAETATAMVALGISSETTPTPEQIIKLGEELSVDAVFFGTVEEYGLSKSGRQRYSEVTAVFGLTETQTGVVVWRAQVHKGGTSVWKKLFGGEPAGLYEVSRRAVREALETLF